MSRAIRIEGDIAYVPLTKGLEAIIDASDAPLVEGRLWQALVSRSRPTYATCTDSASPARKPLRMHRLVIGAPDGVFVDHIDGNGINNRRSNLRLATIAENNRNSRRRSDNTSGVKGVCWHKAAAKWVAQIQHEGRRMHLGTFETVDAAAAAYAEASARLHGQYGRT